MAAWKQKILLLLLFTIITIEQTSVCYSNCKAGFCLNTNALSCIQCDQGQVNLNGKCLADSSQPQSIRIYQTTDNNTLTNASRNTKPITCVVSYNSTSSNKATSSLVYVPVLGTTFTRNINITEKHQYIQLKFNAVIVELTTIFLQYNLKQKMNSLANARVSNSPTNSSIQIKCGNSNTTNTIVPNVFNIRRSISSSASSLILEVKSLSANADFGISNIQIFYGSCHQTCRTCNGPSNIQCLTCQGFYMQIVNGTCQTCPEGYFDTKKQCEICPIHCISCSSLTNCTACQSYAVLSSGKCATNLEVRFMTRSLNFSTDFDTISSQSILSPLTLCGKYSLIGGIGTGIRQTVLSKYFIQLQVHTTIDITFTLFLIDQNQDDVNQYKVFIDQILYVNKNFSIQPDKFNWVLSDQCGTSQPEMQIIVNLKNISHSANNLTFGLVSPKNFYGIRDFALIIHNQTNVNGCASQVNGTCTSCLLGFSILNQSCITCPTGYYNASKDKTCDVCPLQCLTCDEDISHVVFCLTCISPLTLSNNICVDSSSSLFSRQIVPNSLSTQQNLWSLYPKLPLQGITTCGPNIIIGSSEIQYKFLVMNRTFNNLPSHNGMKIFFQFYQIDDFQNDSVIFVLNGKNIPYVPKVERIQICGDNNMPDAIVKMQFQDLNHNSADITFQVIVNGKIKVGINNFMLFLYNCPGCNNKVDFTLTSVPIYSLSTPPEKGMQVKVVFSEAIKNRSSLQQCLSFSIAQPLAQSSRLLQGLISLNNKLPINRQTLVANKEYKSLVNLDMDYNQMNFVATPNNFWNVVSQGQTQYRNRQLNSQTVSQNMPRYIDMDETQTNNRRHMRNLQNLFQGCAIVALWIGLISFFFGFSSAFDDFFILAQIIFAHIFIQYAYNPPSFRLPLQGLRIVQFMQWLPSQARSGIQSGIIPSSFYQYSPLQYEQYFQDIIFARTIYHTILYLLGMFCLYLLLVIFHNIVTEKKKIKPEYQRSFFIKYFNDYQQRRFTFIDKVMRWSYFTAIWAAALQFVNFNNQPTSFNIWNSILCVFIFVVFALYPIAGFMHLRRMSNGVSVSTFERSYQQVRINSAYLFYYLFRYYKLLAMGLIIGLLWNSNPLATLIPLIVLHLVDAVLLLVFKPLGMSQVAHLNVCFYKYYPMAYFITSIIQSFLFILLQIFIVIMYSLRDNSTTQVYMALGYTCCGIIVTLLFNGIVRMVWGVVKILEAAIAKAKDMALSVENKVNQMVNNQELLPINKSLKHLQNGTINNLQSRSRFNSMASRKKSIISRIF